MSSFGERFREEYVNDGISREHLNKVKQVEDIIQRKIKLTDFDDKQQTITINDVPKLSQQDVDWINLDLDVRVWFVKDKHGNVNHNQIIVNPFKEGESYPNGGKVIARWMTIGLVIGIIVMLIFGIWVPLNTFINSLYAGFIVFAFGVLGVQVGLTTVEDRVSNYETELRVKYEDGSNEP